MKTIKKRMLSLLLVPLTLLGLAFPAAAADESVDARLKRVTETVKETLDLDTEAYDDFRGEVYEQELDMVWNLRWSGEAGNLTVGALEDGTVVSLWRSDGGDVGVYRYGNLPTMSKVDGEAAKKAAQAFLDRVLGPGEAATVESSNDWGGLYDSSRHYSGRISLNGLPSPLNWNITVEGEDCQVTSFNRGAAKLSYLGGVPDPKPAVSADRAAQTLRQAQELELIYVPAEGQEHRAVLRYVPKSDRSLCVDAQTGELKTPGAELYTNSSAEAVMAEDTGTGGSLRKLTQAELTGIEKLEGVLTSAELDAAVRQESAYGLEGWELTSCGYRLVSGEDQEKDQVWADLRYAQGEEKEFWPHMFTVDARSGKVLSLTTYEPWTWESEKDQESKVTAEQARQTAEAFLGRFTDKAGELALYDTEDRSAEGARSYGFTFARKLNGYFYPTDSAAIRIDRLTGAVTGVSLNYDEQLEADSAENLISAEAALDAWMEAHQVTLAYRSLTRDLDPTDPADRKLTVQGYTRFDTLFLSYGLEREDWCPGIDAKTGLPVEQEQTGTEELAYSDLEGHWAEKEVKELAALRIGYDGGVFDPDRPLTQWDLVCLIASTQGSLLDPEEATEEQKDSAYRTAYRMEALTREERDEEAPVDRGTLVRALLGSAGFGEVLGLEGIFTCDYADAASIPPSQLGCAALAQAFGLVRGAYAPTTPATRAMAAVMLYRLMNR